jgi:hypothetical protein
MPNTLVERFLFSVSYIVETLPFGKVVATGVTLKVYVSFWMPMDS